MRGNASKSPDKQVSAKAALAQMLMMLSSARSLDSFTPTTLARLYRVPERDCEYHLAIAKQRRANAR